MKIKYIALVASLFMSVGAFAQHNEEVTIEGAYRPKVNKVNKIVLRPETPEQSYTMPGSEVNVLDVERRFGLNIEKISPLAYNTKKGAGDNLAKNFLMAGFGTRISPLFLFNHNSSLSKSLDLSVGLKHFSSWLDIKQYAPSGFMNNAVEVGLAKRDFYDMQLRGKVYYKNDAYHYYGVKLDEIPVGALVEKVAPQQQYNTIGARFDLSSTTTRLGEFRHNAALDYHYLFSKVGAGTEHFVKANYDLAYANSWWGKKSYPQKVGVTVDAQYGLNGFVEQASVSRGLVRLNPYFEMSDDFYRLHLGVGFDVPSDFRSATGGFGIYPDVKGSLFVLNNALEFYAGLNGDRKWKSYSELIGENPFVYTISDMQITMVKLGFEGGIRTNILNAVDLHVGVRYRNTARDLFFRQCINTSGDAPYNCFDVIYDDTKQVSVLGNIRWLIMDKLTVDAGFSYNKCDPANEAHAWYRPTTEGELKVNYRLNESLSFDASFLYQGGLWAHQAVGKTYQSLKLADVYDLGLGAEYKIKDQFSVFVKADNLLNRKYQLFVNYPVSGIEAFAGLKMAF